MARKVPGEKRLIGVETNVARRLFGAELDGSFDQASDHRLRSTQPPTTCQDRAFHRCQSVLWLAAVAVFFLTVVLLIGVPLLVVRFRAVHRGPPKPCVALTIDDGPGPETAA